MGIAELMEKIENQAKTLKKNQMVCVYYDTKHKRFGCKIVNMKNFFIPEDLHIITWVDKVNNRIPEEGRQVILDLIEEHLSTMIID